MNEFANLTPEFIFEAVEKACGCGLTGHLRDLPSYINRVYELEDEDGKRIIAKFYRPGRWTQKALLEEHQYLYDCVESEIPVIPPIKFRNGQTLFQQKGQFMAAFPKLAGREFEINTSEEWIRIGSLLGRLHAAGVKRKADNRIHYHPEKSTLKDADHLINKGFVPNHLTGRFKEIIGNIIDFTLPLYNSVDYIRVHGDFHRGNILDRQDEGLMLIDFDDMMMAPAVQDFWLMLPNHLSQSMAEMEWMLEGYVQFMDFDKKSLTLIEPLRAMRIIYFLAWCSTQVDDFQFKSKFPLWGTANFWKNEIDDLTQQYHIMLDQEL
ncbi:MAG: serine/threonine protein kinase [bacterium]